MVKLIYDLVKFVKNIEIDGILFENNGQNISIVEVINKYNSTKRLSLKISIDDKISKKYDKITYICPICNSESKILVCRFIHKKTKYCYKCKENKEEKRKKHSEFIKNSYSKHNKVAPLDKIREKNIYDLSEELFESESENYKLEYFNRNLTKEEFLFLRDKIISVNGVEIMGKKIDYYPFIKVNNQMKYSSKVLVDGKLILLTNCVYICDICSNEFKGRNMKKKISSVLCTSCNFSNKVFKFKSIKNIDGYNVVYQSNPELKLIKKLNDKKILIKNGPKIKYLYEGNIKVYKVDFEIPIINELIEIKDNHIWHREQVNSGKWGSKESAAIDWCVDNNYTYELVFDVDHYINKLLNRLENK